MRTICVSLLSGGLDSCVASAWAKGQGYELRLLSANYGQVMQRELQHANEIAKWLQPVEHRILEMSGFGQLSWSSRTDSDLIESNRPFDPAENFDDTGKISNAYPPGRDGSLLLMAAAWVESLMLQHIDDFDEGKIVIGTNANDAAMFPDCRPQAYALLNRLLETTTKVSLQYSRAIVIETPLIDLNKAEVVELGRRLGAPLEQTWSCYEGGAEPCGTCDPCKLRNWAFSQNEHLERRPSEQVQSRLEGSALPH